MEILHKLQNLRLVNLVVLMLRQIIICNQYAYFAMNAISIQTIATLKQLHMLTRFCQHSQHLNLKQLESGNWNYKHVNIHSLQIRQESERLKPSLLHIAKNANSRQIYGFVSLADILVVEGKTTMAQEVIIMVLNTSNKQDTELMSKLAQLLLKAKHLFTVIIVMMKSLILNLFNISQLQALMFKLK